MSPFNTSLVRRLVFAVIGGAVFLALGAIPIHLFVPYHKTFIQKLRFTSPDLPGNDSQWRSFLEEQSASLRNDNPDLMENLSITYDQKLRELRLELPQVANDKTAESFNTMIDRYLEHRRAVETEQSHPDPPVTKEKKKPAPAPVPVPVPIQPAPPPPPKIIIPKEPPAFKALSLLEQQIHDRQEQLAGMDEIIKKLQTQNQRLQRRLNAIAPQAQAKMDAEIQASIDPALADDALLKKTTESMAQVRDDLDDLYLQAGKASETEEIAEIYLRRGRLKQRYNSLEKVYLERYDVIVAEVSDRFHANRKNQLQSQITANKKTIQRRRQQQQVLSKSQSALQKTLAVTRSELTEQWRQTQLAKQPPPPPAPIPTPTPEPEPQPKPEPEQIPEIKVFRPQLTQILAFRKASDALTARHLTWLAAAALLGFVLAGLGAGNARQQTLPDPPAAPPEVHQQEPTVAPFFPDVPPPSRPAPTGRPPLPAAPIAPTLKEIDDNILPQPQVELQTPPPLESPEPTESPHAAPAELDFDSPQAAASEPETSEPPHATAFDPNAVPETLLQCQSYAETVMEMRKQTTCPIVLVTALVAEEASPRFATNLAIVLQKQKLRILLVEADQDSTALARQLTDRPTSPGFFEWRRGAAWISQASGPTQLTDITFMPSGIAAPEQCDRRLDLSRERHRWANLMNRFDVILLYSPTALTRKPKNPQQAAAANLVNAADGFFALSKSEKPQKVTQKILNNLKDAKAQPLAIINLK